jgi:hypothetical protein
MHIARLNRPTNCLTVTIFLRKLYRVTNLSNIINHLDSITSWWRNVDNDVITLVDKLKHGAVDRCRERVIRAAGQTKYDTTKKVESTPRYGLTSHLRERRGL